MTFVPLLGRFAGSPGVMARRAVIRGRVQGVGFRYLGRARSPGARRQRAGSATCRTARSRPSPRARMRPWTSISTRLRARPRSSGRVDGVAVEPAEPQGLTSVRDHTMTDFRAFIRDVPDFPSPGILFRDVTPLLASPEAFVAAARAMAEPFRAAQAREGPRHRGARISLRHHARPRAQRRHRSGAQARQAPARHREHLLRPRVRQGLPRDALRLVSPGRAGPDRGRRARHRRNGEGRRRPRGAARRRTSSASAVFIELGALGGRAKLGGPAARTPS